MAGHAVEWGGYENDCLLLDVRSRVDADGTLPKSFELEEGIPVELVIHDGDDFKGVYIDLPRESEGGVSVWVDEEQRAAVLKPGSVTSTLIRMKMVLRQDGNGSCFGQYRFYAWIADVSPWLLPCSAIFRRQRLITWPTRSRSFIFSQRGGWPCFLSIAFLAPRP